MHFIKQLLIAFKQHHFKGLFIQISYYYNLLLAKYNLGKRQTCFSCGATDVVFIPLLVQPVGVRKSFSCPKCTITYRHSYYAELSKKYIIGELDTKKELIVYHFIPEEGLVKFWKKELPNAEYHLTCYPGKIVGFELLDVTNLNLPSDSVDIIIINHVLCCTPDIVNVFKELHRVLKPRGMAIVGESVVDDKTTKELTVFNPYGTRYRTFGKLDLSEVIFPFQGYRLLRDDDLLQKYIFDINKNEALILLRK